MFVIPEVKKTPKSLSLLTSKDLKYHRKQLLCFVFSQKKFNVIFPWKQTINDTQVFMQRYLLNFFIMDNNWNLMRVRWPNPLSSLVFVFISSALLSLHSATLFTPLWCSHGLSESLNKDNKAVSSQYFRIY